MNNNTSKKQTITNSMIAKIIIDGKPHIYKNNHLEWTQYVMDVLKKDSSYKSEFEATVWIMQKLASSEISISEMINNVKDMNFSTERLYHIINDILYYYKEGPDFFKKFYQGYMNPQLESMVNKIEIRNNHYANIEESEYKSSKSI